jgi:hypothetical protein
MLQPLHACCLAQAGAHCQYIAVGQAVQLPCIVQHQLRAGCICRQAAIQRQYMDFASTTCQCGAAGQQGGTQHAFAATDDATVPWLPL